MRCGSKLRNYQIAKLQDSQRGYIMITLMLALALITIGLLAVLPEIAQQIKRDREEEMRHRGTAYMRAIQHFYKKFGRYPSRVEDLENTNNLRFLRKRYTDPLSVDRATGKEKDFKLLYQQDITLNQGPLLGPTGGPQGGAPGVTLPVGGPSAPGGPGIQPGGLQPDGPSGTPAPASGDSNNSSDAEENSNSTGSSSSSSSGSGFNGPTFGGGPILGVVSTSKAKSIRVFFGKDHYKDWLFIYVPQFDRGGLLTGPVSLNGPTGLVGPMTPGQPLMPGGGMTPNLGQPQNNQMQPSQGPGQTSPQQ